MNRQTVDEAIEILHSPRYRVPHDRVLAMENERPSTTVALNKDELELLAQLVADQIGKERKTWYDITHDEDISALDMAYELAGTVVRKDRYNRLYRKLQGPRT